MRMQTLTLVLGTLLFGAGTATAQTEKIQKQIEQKLAQERKEQASLEELLTQALKNNPDIRLAEAKAREAVEQAYVTRMHVLGKVAQLRNDVLSAKAAADEAASRYARDKSAYDKGGLAATEMTASAAAMEKFKYDWAARQAELDALVGKFSSRATAYQALKAGMTRESSLDEIPSPDRPGKAGPGAARLQPGMVEKIRKALDAPYKGKFAGEIEADDVVAMLRERTQGVNVLTAGTLKGSARVEFVEPIPLGAFYQWAEDQFRWRFIVRDYGIVVAEAGAVPPGGVPLLELWRQGPPAAPAPQPK